MSGEGASSAHEKQLSRFSRVAEWFRGYRHLPELSAGTLSKRWLFVYWRGMLFQWDTAGFLGAGLAIALVADRFRAVEADGEGILVALTAIGFAALAVVLTALTIFVTFVNEAYLRVLTVSKKGGLSGYIVPYLAAALISTATTTFGAVTALVYGAVTSAGWRAAFLGIEVGLVVWTAWAVFQLVVEIAVHGLNRYELTKVVEESKSPDISEIVRRESARSAERRQANGGL